MATPAKSGVYWWLFCVSGEVCSGCCHCFSSVQLFVACSVGFRRVIIVAGLF
jgi:hypothetical protein